jgi:hypothetical protein
MTQNPRMSLRRILPSSVLTERELPAAELAAARLDGELFLLDSCYCPVDQWETPELRAAVISARWPSRLIAEQRSAAWVLGALDLPPQRHELCAALGARSRPSETHEARIREVVIEPEELGRVGALCVTSPLRTILDLTRFRPEFGNDDREMVRRLLAIGGLSPEQCVAALDARRNLPNKKTAVGRILSVVSPS